MTGSLARACLERSTHAGAAKREKKGKAKRTEPRIKTVWKRSKVAVQCQRLLRVAQLRSGELQRVLDETAASYEEPRQEVAAHSRRRRNRQLDLSRLPHHRHELDLPEAESRGGLAPAAL